MVANKTRPVPRRFTAFSLFGLFGVCACALLDSVVWSSQSGKSASTVVIRLPLVCSRRPAYPVPSGVRAGASKGVRDYSSSRGFPGLKAACSSGRVRGLRGYAETPGTKRDRVRMGQAAIALCCGRGCWIAKLPLSWSGSVNRLCPLCRQPLWVTPAGLGVLGFCIV